jgi:hypothetical protein
MVAMAKEKFLRWSATLEVAAHGILMSIFRQMKYHRNENYAAKRKLRNTGYRQKGPNIQ